MWITSSLFSQLIILEASCVGGLAASRHHSCLPHIPAAPSSSLSGIPQRKRSNTLCENVEVLVNHKI